MNTPSITPAQIAAFLQPILTLLVAFGLPLSENQETAIIGVSGSLSTALIVADMFIRRARANNAQAIVTGQLLLEAAKDENSVAAAYVPESD
jgi:hypothetical protein